MKKTLLLLVLLLTLTFVFGCKKDSSQDDSSADNGTSDVGGSDNSGGDNTTPDPDTQDQQKVIYKIVCSDGYTGQGTMNIYYALGLMESVELSLGNDSAGVAEREIVLGRTNREISKTAYDLLPKSDNHEDSESVYSGFVIYSDGKSVAIAYDEDEFGIGAAESAAVEYFINNYISGKKSLVLEKGIMAKDLVDIVAYQRAKDEESREKSYNAIRISVMNSTGDATLADDIVEAFRKYYALTTPDLTSWIANLYEPDIDAATRGENDPMRGGFYFSNSARNTEGFLPDLESTAQALMILHYSGLLDHVGGQSGLPDWMKQQIGNFAKSLQDPNGFFYHPQWGKEMTDRNQERRARDAGSARGLLGLAGMSPTYSIYETAGDGTLIDGTKVDAQGNVIPASHLTSRLCDNSIAVMVSRVIPTAQTYVSPELLTEKAFYEWLDGGCGYNIRNGSYGWGSFVCSRDQEYLQRDKQLAAENADWRCSEVLINYLNEHRNPANGTWEWGDESGERFWYNATNGILKIGGTYTSFGVEMPYALEACQAAINAINSDTTPIHICDVYNPWFAVSNTLKNLSSCSANLEEGRAKAAEVRRALLADAPVSIVKTLEKRSIFKKVDGSFSYFPGNSSQSSTGMPVALKGINEGDVNATVIAAIDIRDRMCNALGLPTVDILGTADYINFITILEELGPVIKDEDTSVLEPITFDDYKQGETPNDDAISTAGLASGGYNAIIDDPRPKNEGNVFRFETKKGKGDTLRFPTGDTSIASNCSVFEAEMCFESVSAGYTLQLSLEYNYMIGMRFDSERCHLFETSSQTATRIDGDFEASVPIGEWFKLRVEYYPGDEDTVRIKVYLNDELIAVSDNYYDFYGYKITNGTGTPAKSYSYAEILGMTGAEFVLLLDNVVVGKTRTAYKITNNDPSLAIDVDAPAKEQQKYDFDDAESSQDYPDGFTVVSGSDTVEIKGDENKSLYIKGNKGDSFKIDIPATRVTQAPNSTTVSMDVSFLSYDVGAAVQLGLRQRGSDFLEYAVTGYILKIEEIDGKKYVVMYECVRDQVGAKVGGIQVPAENSFNLKIEYYTEQKTTLIYINNTLLGLSSAVNAGVEKYKIGELVIKSPTKLGYEVLLDNIIVENGKCEFDEATKPTVERVVHTFDSSDGITVGEGASISSGVASIMSGGYITVPLNKRSISAGTVVLDTLLSVSSSDGDMSIAFTDSEGNSLIVYTLRARSGRVYIHETTETKTYGTSIASFAAGKTVNLMIEYYTAKDIIQISVDGKCIAVSSLQYNDNAAKTEISAVKLCATSGSMVVDDLVIEAYNKLYTEQDTDGDNTEDGKEKLTFESSTGGNLPSAVTYSFGSGGASVRVDEMMKQTERSKVLILTTSAGGADTLTVSAVRKQSAYSCVAFEADVSLAFNGSVYLFFRAETKDIYRINLNMTNGSLHVDDNPGFPPYGTMGNPDIKIGLNKWVNLRFEFYNKDDGSIAVKVAVNGKFLKESNETSWTGNISSITSVNMTTNTGGIGDFMIDDLYFGFDTMSINTDDVYVPEGGSSGDGTGGSGSEDEGETVVPTEKNPETFEDGKHSIAIDGGSTRTPGSIVTEGDNSYYNKPTNTSDYLYFNKSLYAPEDADCTVFEAKLRINHKGSGACSFKIYYGTWKGMEKFTIYNPSGDDLVIYDSRSGVNSTLTGGIGAKIGEWFTLRIENYQNSKEETIARVYVNGKLVGESSNIGVLGSASENHTLNTVALLLYNNIRGTGAEGDVYGSVDIDDVYLGADVMLEYDGRPVEDFEDGLHGITIDGGSTRTPGSIVTEGDNSYYNKPTDTSDYLYFQKSAYELDGADSIVFEAKLRVNHKGSGACSFKIYYGTWKGMEKFTIYNLTGDGLTGEDLAIYDSRSGVSSTLSAGIGAKTGEWFTLRIENYINDKEETVARVFVNGILIGESTNIGVLGSASENHTLNTVALLLHNNIRGTGAEGDVYGSVDIDDVYLGADKMTVIEAVKNVENFDDEEAGATNLTSSPSVSTSIDSGTATTSVKEADGNKYFEINKTSNGTAALYANKTLYTGDYDCYVFEADLKLNITSTNIQNNIYIYAKTGGHVHRLWLYNDTEKPGELFLLDYWAGNIDSSTLKVYPGIALTDEVKLRIEYYNDADGKLVARVYVDGTMVGESKANITASYEDITRNDIWLTGATVCTVGVDNVYSGFDKMIVEESEEETKQPEETPAE